MSNDDIVPFIIIIIIIMKNQHSVVLSYMVDIVSCYSGAGLSEYLPIYRPVNLSNWTCENPSIHVYLSFFLQKQSFERAVDVDTYCLHVCVIILPTGLAYGTDVMP